MSVKIHLAPYTCHSNGKGEKTIQRQPLRRHAGNNMMHYRVSFSNSTTPACTTSSPDRTGHTLKLSSSTFKQCRVTTSHKATLHTGGHRDGLYWNLPVTFVDIVGGSLNMTKMWSLVEVLACVVCQTLVNINANIIWIQRAICLHLLFNSG